RVVEVAIFEGGYGIDWHQAMAERFNEANRDRGVRIELWGDPRTADIVKPRLLRGDPPDLILDERLPLWLLIAREKLIPFTEALEVPPLGSDRPWGDLFARGMLDMFRSDGEVYALPAAYGAWTGWYDARMFREHGWAPPETWQELLDLCEEIEAAGIAPWTLQGKYAHLYAWNTYLALVQRVGGLAAINRINALDAVAFSHPDAVEAARLLQELALRFMQRGAMAMTHTESQLHFVQGNAAMTFCGIWLENEMKDTTPPDFEMRSFTIPAVEGGKGNPRLLNGQGMEYLFVPSDARYPELAFEFARFMVSPDAAAEMGESIGVISPLAGATPRESLTPALQSVLDIIEASDGIFNVRVYMLFPAWRTQVMGVAIADLLRGEITPEEFGRRLDAGVAAALEDPDVIVPGHVPYDAALLGESE
ncbi:MAG: extracellular solute-binding protein, partial [Candidatus Hydrogenedentes bacterium]|nr:extracellular solute-binding protein [Candidatus Hydrogenedentota bacterium]